MCRCPGLAIAHAYELCPSLPLIVAYPTLQDALLALSEGAKVFIQYLTAAANAVCKGAGRQTLSEDDVYAALADIQFAEFVPPLQEAAKGEPTQMLDNSATLPATLLTSIGV